MAGVLFLLLPIIAGACGGSGASGQDGLDGTIHLETHVSQEHYSVQGTTTEAIFAYLGENGPTDETGERGTGLTTARWSYSWQGKVSGGRCAISSMSIKLDINVILPQHEQLQQLDADLRRRWLTFADTVAAHEQRHVDIHEQGAEELRQRMVAIGPRETCAALESVVSDAWSSEQAEIDARQDSFHREEDARLRAERAPIEKQIQDNRQLLAALAANLRDLERGAADLRRELDSLQQQISASKSQVELILRAYPSGMPGNVYAQYQTVSQQYSSQVTRYNRTIDQYNALVEQQAPLQDRLEDLQTQAAALVEVYNWTR